MLSRQSSPSQARCSEVVPGRAVCAQADRSAGPDSSGSALLARAVRFSINPFLPRQSRGYNSFASEPTGEGLAIFLELLVELIGPVEPNTGFVVNVVDIDREVRSIVVPIFTERIRADFQAGSSIALRDLAELLRLAWNGLNGRFDTAKLSRLTLKLNPYRKLAIGCKEGRTMYFTEKFGFAATHKLWNTDFSERRNIELFGKCANPAGHGHNYVLEVTIEAPKDKDIAIGEFERVVDAELVQVVDHKNLNVDVPEFASVNPTVENIAVFAWKRLAGKFRDATLRCVTVWETDKTYCSYYGPGSPGRCDA